jgi:Flp pilus assembly protein TadB
MSNDQYPERSPERPRVEPEIIPPGQDARASREASGMWMRFEDRGGTHRVFIARPGLASIIFGLLIIGLIAAVVFVVLAGIVLVWVPLLIAAIVLALLSGAIRHRWWRLKTWWAGGR